MNVVKTIIKGLSIFCVLDVVYFIVLKIVFELSGDTDTLLMAEGFVFCSLLYSYLGVRFLHCVKKIELSLSRTFFAGITFFIAGFLITIGPVHIVSGLCDWFGVILFDVADESNVQIIFLWLICSVVMALICYEIAERIFKETDDKE